jgi:hypothetical protein
VTLFFQKHFSRLKMRPSRPLSICMYPCPIFIRSFNAEAKQTCPPIFVAEVPRQIGGIGRSSFSFPPIFPIRNNYLLSAKTYQLSANSLSASLLSAGFNVHLFLQDSRSDPLSSYFLTSHRVYNGNPSPLGDEWLCPAFNPPDIIPFFVLFAPSWFNPFVVQASFQDSRHDPLLSLWCCTNRSRHYRFSRNHLCSA